jgi:predicted TIM-barrel fold metal-dependent hydrolase
MKSSVADDMTVIDFGAHHYPAALGEYPKGGSAVNEFGTDRLQDPETLIEEMEEGGIDIMVQSANRLLGNEDVELVEKGNDSLIDMVEEYDEFYGLGALPINAGGEIAAGEFERCLDNGLQGGGLHETEVGLTDEEMEPVLEVADQSGAPLFIHIPELPHDKHRDSAIFGREVAQQKSISAVIHEGIYDSYPNLNIVWHHLGGNIASMLGRVHLQLDEGRWPKQDHVVSFEEYKAQLEDRVYVDSSGFFGYTAPLRVALEEFPSTQVLFATDYPWEPRSGEELGDFVDSVLESGTRKDAKQILGENALDLMVNTDH